MKPLLQASSICFAYGATQIIRNASFVIDDADTVALLGPNGAGKTTLLKLCAGLLSSQTGEVLYRGRPLHSYSRRKLAKRIALVPQEVHVSFDFTVQQFVEQGRTPHLPGLFGGLREQDRRAVTQAMQFADVTHLRFRSLKQLSGGERQRAKIALAIAQEPELLLLDEPTQHLDIRHQEEVFTVLHRLNRMGVTVLAAVHDLQSALTHFASAILIYPDRSVGSGHIRDAITLAAVQEVFGLTSACASAHFMYAAVGSNGHKNKESYEDENRDKAR